MVGSNPATVIGGEKMMKKVHHLKVTELVYATKRFQMSLVAVAQW
jgi:hypothetical protein